MDATVREQLRGRGVYFAFTGGCAALAASHMTLEGVHFPDLGMAEAVWIIGLDRLLLWSGSIQRETTLFGAVREHAHRAAGPGQRQECT